ASLRHHPSFPTRRSSDLARARGGDLERVKSISRSASAADAESYRPELLGEDEPRYLRRQKPVEIRRKKFSGRGWPFYRRALVYRSEEHTSELQSQSNLVC